ncbi:MAG: hypothetical protein WAW79_01025 [Steroidobacteraceae bacterium]
MNIDMSPRVRHIVSGLAAIATTGLLMTTLVESFSPLPGSGTAAVSAPANTTAADTRLDSSVVRKV